jgi:pimeloyl-ACP methyl ester carboxylesterase
MQLEHNIKQPTGDRKPTPVLLLHGAWHGAWAYDLWMDEFAARGYETHSMSLPGHGKSSQDRHINLYSMRDYVQALDTIVREISPTPFVVGHSMGGMVLQQYLKTHQLPGAVLLASIPVFGALPSLLRYIRHHPLRFLVGQLTLNLRYLVNTPELAGEIFLTEGATMTPEQLNARLEHESFRGAIEYIFLLRGDPRRVKTPLLVVAGDRDGLFPTSEEKRTAEAYGAEFLLVKDQGHNLMIERDYRQVAASICDWFDRIGSPR